MRARVARKLLARWHAQGDASTYRVATVRRALGRWQRAITRLTAAGGGRLVWTRDRHTWRWAWMTRAAAAGVGVRGRRAWLALQAAFIRRIREHQAGGRPFAPLVARERRKVAAQ
jgi:hypothetical protein